MSNNLDTHKKLAFSGKNGIFIDIGFGCFT